MKAVKRLGLALIPLAAMVWFHCGDDNIAGTGSQTETAKVRGKIVTASGAPAAGVKVRLIPVTFDPHPVAKRMAAVDSVTTNAAGEFGFDTAAAGAYNVLADSSGEKLAYSDSITVTADSQTTVPTDTIKAPGSLAGKIRLQPGDDARKVFIIALGTNTFASPADTSGSFGLANMAEGSYRVRIMSTLDNYGVLDTVLPVAAGRADTLASDIVLPYTGIPVPTGLKIAYDTLKQIVILSWNKPTTGRTVAEYNIYRKHQDSSAVLLKADWPDTVYHDSTGIQDQTYEYRLTAVDAQGSEGVKATGVAITKIGAFVCRDTLGGAQGFDLPRAAAANDSYYVVFDLANPYPSSVVAKVFSSDGQAIRSFTVRASNSSLAISPLSSAMDKVGNIYIAFSDTILAFDVMGTLVHSYPFAFGDALARHTALYLADTVQVYSLDRISQFLTVRDLEGDTTASFAIAVNSYGSYYLSVDSAGNVFVADGMTGRISKYERNGTAISSWLSQSSGIAQSRAFTLASTGPGGTFIVDDAVEDLVKIYNVNGALSCRFTTFLNTKTWKGTVNDNSEHDAIIVGPDKIIGILEGNTEKRLFIYTPATAFPIQ